ncbi:hypothetical protein ABMA28_003093 [Loxostege sticticalis]|uniref:Integrase catalytic domain-containing protein n=1 Tax=Loxostege sticticalis TaxID=481309 RepID=A0ABD0SV06_LOXSC
MSNAEDNLDLSKLLTRRSSAKGQITKFKNYLNSILNSKELTNIQLTELKLKLAKFEALSVKVDDLQNDIEVLNSDNIANEIEERDNIERDIIINIATAKTLLENFTKKLECENRRTSMYDASFCVDTQDNYGLKLPQIQISKFDGAYFRWLEFRDTFENLIHNNLRISPIHKFHYLISYLEGDAARVISNLEVSSVNYDEAWKLLCNRYNNKRILINHHLNALFNVKPLPRESERSLRFIVDHVTKNLRALASLGQPTDKWDVLIIFMLSSKLDSTTLAKWEEHRSSLSGDTTTLEQFFNFIIDRANVLESLARNKFHDTQNSIVKPPVMNARNNSGPNNKQNPTSYVKSFASSNSKPQNKVFKSNNYTCVICSDNHKIYDCPIFKAKDINERLIDVSKYRLCSNCLRQGLPVSECRMGPCRECNARHNSLLHESASLANNHVSVEEPSYDTIEPSESGAYFSKQNSNQILLSTAIVDVLNPLNRQKVKVRALLDCGSQSSFISKSLKDKISLKSIPIDSLKVIGIGNNSNNSINITESCNIQMNSLNSNFNVSFSCLVLNELTGRLPKYPVNIESIKLPTNTPLADPKFYEPGPIDLLIGQLSLGPQNPKLISSNLGWIISGSFKSGLTKNNTYCHHALVSPAQTIENKLDNMLTKFWDLEEVPTKSLMSAEEKECEKHFVTHTRRNNEGRFCVTLPLVKTPDCLGDTFNLAKRRLNYLEKRFRKNPLLKSEYCNFIKEYSDLGHLSLATNKPDHCYYLCHHAVFKQESESTKLRVVFDGSAPSSTGLSLNDILRVGPSIQDSLFSILIRARQYKFLLTGDIEKMYRQVLVAEKNRDLQRILWREDESKPIQIFKLNTITYGTASASYLSTRCLWELGEEQDDELIKTIIQKDFYVDDLITGANSELALSYIQQSVSKALESGCFKLRKYKSNIPTIFQNINVNEHDALTISESSSTLGLGWTPSNDMLHFPIKNFLNNENDVITKRVIMSNSFKIFDPLGILSPVVIQPKIILQRLWQQKMDWDEPVTQEIKGDWLKFTDNLSYLKKLQVPRWVLCEDYKYVELHSFSDASQHAYGACIYLKSINAKGESKIFLLCAKSKVAPLKPTTIPRLELCAALLSAKLCKLVLDSLRYKPEKIIHWCDSSVVLSWINSDLTKLKIFVANRISEILELTKSSSWRYVPTAVNPADLISRGVDAKNLIDSSLWWYGPSYLKYDESHWPCLQLQDAHILPETKVLTTITNDPFINFDKYSSLNRLQRSLAYVIRFIFNLKNKNNKRVGILTVEELRESFHALCVNAQRESFATEYNLLLNSKSLPSKTKILSLSPFLDNKIIRVGGRIDASACSFEKKHPILLHANHRLTKLYFEREHVNGMHAGPQLLLANVREVVWPVNGRHLARRTVNNCVVCRRLRGKTLCPKMGNLPSQRITPDFPFLSVGLDFAGPFLIINRKGRGSRLIKCYLCLFVCLRYKAIHLEAVSDLTKDAFIMTLKRFISRRGKPTEIFCDNGRNFVAAAKDIGNFIKQNNEPICDFASQQGITFNFIPAYAPHFGGIYEAGVKSAKHHLKRVMGNSNLTFEEISTLFAQVEAILNSRPLCPMSACPDDLLSLSPGHFIIGRPLNALPTPSLEDHDNDPLRKRYQRLEGIRQHFWHRWSKEYLAELQQRTKWRSNTTLLKVGDLVLLAEDNAPPLNWRMGRVVRLFPGPDGVSRVADVKTVRGCVRRALTRLCPLPTAEDLKC